MQNPPVYLIFSGSYWSTSQGQTDQSTLLNATQNILSGPYLTGLTQYGASGTATFANSYDDSNTLAISFSSSSKTYKQPTAATLQSYVTQANTSNSGPALNPNAIYIVVSDPTSSNGDGLGQNYPLSSSNSIHMIWLGTTSSNGSVVQDGFTSILSQELADLISHPDSKGISVTPSSKLPASVKGPFANPNEIGDYEPAAPGQTAYGYRLNGDLVQPYWSAQDYGFIVPDGNSQDFYLNSIWNGSKFTNHYNLALVGDQFGANYNDTIQVGSSGNGVQATLNGETVTFDPNVISSVSVYPGGGKNSVQQSAVPAGVSVNVQNGTSLLLPGQALGVGGTLISSNGQYELALQGDSNLVLYRVADGTALWASNTVGKGATEATMQSDGNFVLYNSKGAAVWASNTNGNPGSYLSMQIDGNLVIYKQSSLWSSKTRQPRFPRRSAGRPAPRSSAARRWTSAKASFPETGCSSSPCKATATSCCLGCRMARCCGLPTRRGRERPRPSCRATATS